MKEEFSQYLLTHPTLVSGILKSAYLRPNHPEYEDYKQEVTFILYIRYITSENCEEFEKIAFTYGRCRLLDLRRKEQRQNEHTTPLLPEWDFPLEDNYNLDLISFYKILTPLEKKICQGLYLSKKKNEIVKELQMSRAQFYRHFTCLKEKAKIYFQKS